MPPVAVVIPAYNEAERIGETVTAALTLPSVDAVVVASDGSTDATVRVAMDAGATVWRSRRNQGKAAALLARAQAGRRLPQRAPPGRPRPPPVPHPRPGPAAPNPRHPPPPRP